jgi:hypothetical protein
LRGRSFFICLLQALIFQAKDILSKFLIFLNKTEGEGDWGQSVLMEKLFSRQNEAAAKREEASGIPGIQGFEVRI